MRKIYIVLIPLLMMVLVSCFKVKPRTGDQVVIKQQITTIIRTDNEGNNVTEVKTIESKIFINPKRVASFSYGVADMLNTVGLENAGITHFGISKGSNLPKMLNKFNDKKYPNIGTLFVEDLDVLELFNPEIIFL